MNLYVVALLPLLILLSTTGGRAIVGFVLRLALLLAVLVLLWLRSTGPAWERAYQQEQEQQIQPLRQQTPHDQERQRPAPEREQLSAHLQP
jgi:hypothetical protein